MRASMKDNAFALKKELHVPRKEASFPLGEGEVVLRVGNRDGDGGPSREKFSRNEILR